MLSLYVQARAANKLRRVEKGKGIALVDPTNSDNWGKVSIFPETSAPEDVLAAVAETRADLTCQISHKVIGPDGTKVPFQKGALATAPADFIALALAGFLGESFVSRCNAKLGIVPAAPIPEPVKEEQKPEPVATEPVAKPKRKKRKKEAAQEAPIRGGIDPVLQEALASDASAAEPINGQPV